MWAFLSLQCASEMFSSQKAMWLLTNHFCLFPIIASSFAEDVSPPAFAETFPKFGDPDARMIGNG